MSGFKSRHGFTLIEVLVALVVATLGILAVTSTVISAGRNTNALREESLAHWIAMNVASELRLAEQWPDIGDRDGDVEFAGSEWRWSAKTSSTDVEGLRRVEISVAYAETPDDRVADVVAFVSPPVVGVQFREWTGVVQGRNLRGRP